MREGRNRALHWTLLVGFCLFVHFQGLGGRPLYHEEPRRALVAREMIERGSWLVPTINGAPYLAKPPLFSWLIAGASLAQGGEVTAASARVVSSLSVLFTVLLVYGFAARFLDRRTGLLAGLLTASTGLVVEQGWTAEIDMNFTLWVTGAMLLLYAAIYGERRRLGAWLGAYTFLFLAFLAKGPPCLLFFVPPLVLLLFFRKTRARILRPAHLAGLLLFIVLTGIYVTALVHELYLHRLIQVLREEMVERAAPRSFWTWLGQALLNPVSFLSCLLPWTFLLLPALARAAGKDRREEAHSPTTFLLLCAGLAVVLFSLSAGKASRYLLPLVPLLALVEGAACRRLLDGELPRRQAAFCRICLVVLCGALAAGSLVLLGLHLAGRLGIEGGAGLWLLLAAGFGLGLTGALHSARGRVALGVAVLVIAPALYRAGYVAFRFPRDIEKYSMDHITRPVQRILDSEGLPLYTLTFHRPEFFFYLDRRAHTAGTTERVNKLAAGGRRIACLAQRHEARALQEAAPDRWRERHAFRHKDRDMVLLTSRAGEPR